MRKVLAAKIFSGVVMLGVLSAPVPSLAQGIFVTDKIQETQGIKQTVQQVAMVAKQIEQYKTQLDQYQNMLTNTLAPAAYLWDQSQQVMGEIKNLDDLGNYYANSHGGLQNYLSQFQNAGYYSGSPCFKLGSCNAPTVFNSRSKMSALQTDLNKGQAQVLSKQQASIQSDAATLRTLQTKTKASVGQMQAIQSGNQIASNTANQLLQVRSLMVAQQSAEAAQRQADNDEDARAVASREQLATFSYTKSGGQSW